MKRGFTLIEILIAIAIIGILTAIGIVSYTSVNKRAHDAKRFGDVEQVRAALEMYRSDNGYYPAVNPNSFGLASELQTDLITNGAYMPAIPDDPQSTIHHYYYEATNQDSISGKYYGYCLCAYLETQTVKTSNCGPTSDLPDYCMYGARNP